MLTIGAVLAGGISKRMGMNDKSFTILNEKTILRRSLENINTQVDGVIINTMSDDVRYEYFGFPMVKDLKTHYQGPLIGVLTSMKWSLNNAPKNEFLITVPVDYPFIPKDMVSKLIKNMQSHDISYMVSNSKNHYTVAAWRISLIKDLELYLKNNKDHKIGSFIKKCNSLGVEFQSRTLPIHTDINTPKDLTIAEKTINSI